MKALLDIIKRLRRRKPAPAGAQAATNESAATPDFDSLAPGLQETVRQYFYAASRLMQMINCIRYNRRAVDSHIVISDFAKAERNYILAGMKPIFPPAVQRLSEFKPADLAKYQMLVRLDPDETAPVYAPAMERHVHKLMAQFRADVLDSSNIDHLFHS